MPAGTRTRVATSTTIMPTEARASSAATHEHEPDPDPEGDELGDQVDQPRQQAYGERGRRQLERDGLAGDEVVGVESCVDVGHRTRAYGS